MNHEHSVLFPAFLILFASFLAFHMYDLGVADVIVPSSSSSLITGAVVVPISSSSCASFNDNAVLGMYGSLVDGVIAATNSHVITVDAEESFYSPYGPDSLPYCIEVSSALTTVAPTRTCLSDMSNLVGYVSNGLPPVNGTVSDAHYYAPETVSANLPDPSLYVPVCYDNIACQTLQGSCDGLGTGFECLFSFEGAGDSTYNAHTSECDIFANNLCCQSVEQSAQCNNDGNLDPGELCDGANFGKINGCGDFGFTTGILACTNACGIDTSDCSGALIPGVADAGTCGDDTLNPGEVCDGTSFGNIASCVDIDTFAAGDLSCTATCEYDTSDCSAAVPSVCGNGIIEPGEQCDGTNMGGIVTCEDFFGDLDGMTTSPGTAPLTCTSGCRIDTSFGCIYQYGGGGWCGNGYLDQGDQYALQEQCDYTSQGDVIMGATSCETFGFDTGSLRCFKVGDSALEGTSTYGSCHIDTSNCYNIPPPEPYCGDGVKDIGEQCDGNDDATCGGDVCLSNCICDNPAVSDPDGDGTSLCGADGVCGNNDDDNCPNHPNGDNLGTCINAVTKSNPDPSLDPIAYNLVCTEDADCTGKIVEGILVEYCELTQDNEDGSGTEGDSCGNACDIDSNDYNTCLVKDDGGIIEPSACTLALTTAAFSWSPVGDDGSVDRGTVMTITLTLPNSDCDQYTFALDVYEANEGTSSSAQPSPLSISGSTGTATWNAENTNPGPTPESAYWMVRGIYDGAVVSTSTTLEVTSSLTSGYCGDNTLDDTAGEQCDDGNNDDDDGCSSDCLLEGIDGDGTSDSCSSYCVSETSICLTNGNVQFCGDYNNDGCNELSTPPTVCAGGKVCNADFGNCVEPGCSVKNAPTVVEPQCVGVSESWICGKWSECIDNAKTRSCKECATGQCSIAPQQSVACSLEPAVKASVFDFMSLFLAILILIGFYSVRKR